ncbi:MAG: hypothetical protein HKN20_10875 [Gemmatimonadetes bacterium]|nr:hypothetical protein [Gemmatimonadota bacterium]
MNRVLTMLMIACLLLASGCGNKIDLPQEGDSGEIPFKNYFVYATWTNLGAITDILVTRAQWVYMAEDSATVKRYRAKGGTGGDGTRFAEARETLDGLERPVKLDEGSDDRIWVLDLTDGYPETRPEVRLYDLFQQSVTAAWSDTVWSFVDTLWREPGADSANIRRQIRTVDLRALEADDDDQVFVAGRSFSFQEHQIIQYDTNFVENPTFPGQFDGLTPIGIDTLYEDSTDTWFIRKYDETGQFDFEAVGTGTGFGFGVDISDFTVSEDFLGFIDADQDRVKFTDPDVEYGGFDAIDGTDAVEDGTPSQELVLDPGGVATDPSGFLYISDTGNGRILKYRPDLTFQTRVDQNAPGLAVAPTTIAATDTLVYVYDQAEEKLVLFEFPKLTD